MNKKYQIVRLFVQLLFMIVVLKIGYDFYGFVKYCETNGQTSFFERPPGVEAFLPISSLISLKFFILTGEINPIHPSGLIIFIAILTISFLLKKSFCSWICPVSIISEYLWKLGEKFFHRNFSLPVWLDSILRSLKYIILIFFLWVILLNMDLPSIHNFIYSPYNKVADVKMLRFFTDISSLTLIVLSVLIVLSIFFKNFWCRYLCPYGALVGFISIFSPFKVTRNIDTCTDCRKCTQVCPESIKVHAKQRVYSDQCMLCMACVEHCPEENTLGVRLAQKKLKLSGYSLAVLILSIYISFVFIGKITGNWHSSIPLTEYIIRIKDMNNPIYDHNRGKIITNDKN